MDTDENRLVGFPSTFDQGYVLESVAELAEGDVAKMTVGCGEVHLGGCFYHLLALQAVGDEVADGDDFDAVFRSYLLELRHTGHRAIGVQDLDERSSRLESGEAGKVDGGLGVTGATQHSAVLGVQRVDVSRTTEIGGLGLGVGQVENRGSAVGGTHTCGAAFELIDCYREGCAQHGGVILHLMRQFELLGTADGDGCTENATPFA